jgi:hypothetical protein
MTLGEGFDVTRGAKCTSSMANNVNDEILTTGRVGAT